MKIDTRWIRSGFAVLCIFILLGSAIGVVFAEPYNISDATQVRSQSLDVDYAGDWSENGEYFIGAGVTGTGSWNITIYQASERWNVSSLSMHTQTTIGADSNVRDILIGKDGTRFYVADSGGSNQRIRQFNMSTPYDANTASEGDFIGFGGSGDWFGLYMRPDGSELYVTTQNLEGLYKYDLSTNWELSSASQVDTANPDYSNFDFDNVYDLHFNDDGTKVIFSGPDPMFNARVESQNLTEAYNISSIDSVVRTRTFSENVYSIDFGQNGTRMYTISSTVREYELASFFVSGTVTYAANGTAVDGASITVNSTDVSDTTSSNGEYSLGLDNGTYEITATKGDLNNSITVTVNGSDLTDQNITLSDSSLELQLTSAYMDHGDSQTYQVFLTTGGQTTEVTNDANLTVTSGDTSVVTVDQANATLTANASTSINEQVTISASYNDLDDTATVTVANKTLNNIAILPPSTWPSAVFGVPGDTTGSSSTWPGAIQLQWIFVSLGIGAVVSHSTNNSFIALVGTLGLLAMGWSLDWVSNGVLMAAIVFVTWIVTIRGLGTVDPNIGAKRN